MTIPHWAPPTHAMQIFRYAEQGSIRCCGSRRRTPWSRCPTRRGSAASSAGDDLFVVVQDLYLTETARMADVVLPAATWGEKTGTFTNADRTVHLSEQAVAPPGEARSDLEIFLDYATRMDFRDRDGAPLIRWHDPESTFEAWKECSRGRPCDYSGLTYDASAAAPASNGRAPSAHPDGGRAALRRRPLQHGPRLLRGLRARPDDRRGPHGDGVPGPRRRPAERSCTPSTTSRRRSRPAPPSRCS